MNAARSRASGSRSTSLSVLIGAGGQATDPSSVIRPANQRARQRSRLADHGYGKGDADVLGPDVPIQVQLYRQLRTEILDGLWGGRTGFPGERDLAERYGGSRITSRRALERLAREGLVVRGRGRRATSPYVPPEPPGNGPVWFVLDSEGSPDAFRPLRVGVETAPAEACRAFGLTPGSALWQCV